MTFLDVAEKILKEAGEPLHYGEITERGIARGYLSTSGETPEATMRAKLNNDVKKPDSRFIRVERAVFDLRRVLGDVKISREIDKANDDKRNELLAYLKGMDPKRFEYLIKNLLIELGFEATVTKYVGDGGVDINAVLTVGGVTKVSTAIQVKRYGNQKVGPNIVREMRGSLVTDQRGLIITTSGFTGAASEDANAENKLPISLIDGERLLDLLIENQIGVTRKELTILELNLEDLEGLDDEEEAVTTNKSASLWPLPGGASRYFQTLIEFLMKISADKPTLNELSSWVLERYEKVRKESNVRSFVSSVLKAMGLIQYDGEIITLTETGRMLIKDRDKKILLEILEDTILGISEILEYLASGPASLDDIRAMINDKCGKSWETTHQPEFRMRWLEAAGAVIRKEKIYHLAS